MPKKKFYRQRAHCNPLSDASMDVPVTPADVEWHTHFPAYIAEDGSAKVTGVDAAVRIADVGCGFGGMTIACAPCLLPSCPPPEPLLFGCYRHIQAAAGSMCAASLQQPRGIQPVTRVAVRMHSAHGSNLLEA